MERKYNKFNNIVCVYIVYPLRIKSVFSTVTMIKYSCHKSKKFNFYHKESEPMPTIDTSLLDLDADQSCFLKNAFNSSGVGAAAEIQIDERKIKKRSKILRTSKRFWMKSLKRRHRIKVCLLGRDIMRIKSIHPAMRPIREIHFLNCVTTPKN